jgi:hypothetical protein
VGSNEVRRWRGDLKKIKKLETIQNVAHPKSSLVRFSVAICPVEVLLPFSVFFLIPSDT